MSEATQTVTVALVDKRAPHFFRAGLRFEAGKPSTVEVTEKQLQALEQEPKLKVTRLKASADKGGDQPSTKSEALTVDDLVAHIAELNPDNAELWTSGGKPQTKALADLAGQDVSAALRDEAWAAYEAASAGGDE